MSFAEKEYVYLVHISYVFIVCFRLINTASLAACKWNMDRIFVLYPHKTKRDPNKKRAYVSSMTEVNI